MTTSPERFRVLCVVGARPNFMKIAPLMKVFGDSERLQPILLHTGQHYDLDMNGAFFQELGIPRPDAELGVGSGSQATQTAEIMKRAEPVIDEVKPDAVLVVGDVNSTLACALVAAKKCIAVIHVEAGLRSFDRTMPEEINRVVTDQISDLLFTSERSALRNLSSEGIAQENIRFVGNVMIDTLLQWKRRAPSGADVLGRLGWGQLGAQRGQYGMVTLHRPSNVDDPAVLAELMNALRDVSARVPLVFPVHPRTRVKLRDAGIPDDFSEGLRFVHPLGYLDMVGLLSNASVVLTDSGGIQEETTALGVPCLTLRENTERPITVEQGTNMLVGTSRQRLFAGLDEILANGGKRGTVPELWDGRAAERVGADLEEWLADRSQRYGRC